ncbi:MAG: XdhC family protein [Desulfobacterales bacterium]|nr:XdhC family protein [Desulfobacterales bacterium]
MTDQEIYQKIGSLSAQGAKGCLATIVDAHGSTPREVGAKMIVCVGGETYGSVGGGCGENVVRSAALRAILSTGKPELVTVDLTDDLGTKGGDVCGGRMKIFVEPF